MRIFFLILPTSEIEPAFLTLLEKQLLHFSALRGQDPSGGPDLDHIQYLASYRNIGIQCQSNQATQCVYVHTHTHVCKHSCLHGGLFPVEVKGQPQCHSSLPSPPLSQQSHQTRLALNKDLPVSTSQVLGLKICSSMPEFEIQSLASVG